MITLSLRLLKMVKLVLNHNGYYFCSGPCGMLSDEHTIIDSNGVPLFELKPDNGNRYPKISYQRKNNDIVEVINCRICPECHKRNLDLTEENEIQYLDSDAINVIKKFILLECATEDVIDYIKNDSN